MDLFLNYFKRINFGAENHKTSYMKKLLLLTVSALFSLACLGQDSIRCDSVSLNTPEEIKKAEPCVIIAADYVLSKPLHDNSNMYNIYRQLIITWMGSTSDYSFSLNSNILALTKEEHNELLFGVYAACLAKSALQNKTNFVEEAVKLFADYVANPDNKVQQTANIKKLITSKKENKLEKYL
jgi:hypothetical protein